MPGTKGSRNERGFVQNLKPGRQKNVCRCDVFPFKRPAKGDSWNRGGSASVRCSKWSANPQSKRYIYKSRVSFAATGINFGVECFMFSAPVEDVLWSSQV